MGHSYSMNPLIGYLPHIKSGKKAACEVTNNNKNIKLKDYIVENGLSYFQGVRELWVFKDPEVLDSIIVADEVLNNNYRSKFFDNWSQYHIFLGNLFGYKQSKIKKFVEKMEMKYERDKNSSIRDFI